VIRTRLVYHRPAILDECSEILARYVGNVAILAGGTQLLPQMTRDEIHVEHVVDLRGLGLDSIGFRGDDIEIGAMTTYADIISSKELSAVVPLLGRAARGVTGGRQITCQATVVGALCHNYPGSDMPGVLVALDARIRVYGVSGFREVSAGDFLLNASKVDLRPGEFVVSFFVRPVTNVGYCKIKHSTGSWPIATASAVRHHATGKIAVTLGAVQAVPIRIELEELDRLDLQVRAAVIAPWSDVLAPGKYRAAIAGVVARRAIADLQEYG
jgi:aerobic carbon-monoxide dehydrogenase medium subunit